MIETIVLARRAGNCGGECDCCLDHIHLLKCHFDVHKASTAWWKKRVLSELHRSVITTESGDKKRLFKIVDISHAKLCVLQRVQKLAASLFWKCVAFGCY